jgi:hypothetical protein
MRPAVALASLSGALLVFASGALARSALTRSVALVGRTSGVSGSATVRLGDNEVCWSLWTQGVDNEQLRLAFTRSGSNQPVHTLARPLTLHNGRAEGCRTDSRARVWRREAKGRGFPYRLALIASGRVVLDGRLEDPVDARSQPLG